MTTYRMVLAAVLVFALLSPGAPASQAQPAAPQATDTPTVSSGSMLIVENTGQWPTSTGSGQAPRFQVWGSPLGVGTTWLAEDAIWLVVADGKPQAVSSATFSDPVSDLQPATLQPATLHALKLTFPGSNPDVRIEPFDPLTTTVSYFIGNDPEQWHPAVPVWGGVRYVDLYPGVDLELSAAGARLAARPGADLDAVMLRVEGADAATLDGDTLRLSTAAGEMRLPLLHGDGLPAAGAQVRSRGLEVFEVSAPFATPSPAPRASTDDLTSLLYSTFLGGRSQDVGAAAAVDGMGRATVTGWTWSSDFPTTPGAFDPTYNGAEYYYDAFVARLNAAGSALDYATFLGGSSGDGGSGVAVDGTGRATVTGVTNSSDFPTTPGAFDPTFNGGEYEADAFVARLNAAGSALDYATFLGGSSYDYGGGIAVDATGRATVTGYTRSSDFPTTPGAFDPTLNGDDRDAFVARLNAAGSALDYATFLGGSDRDQGCGVAVDGTGRATVTGYTHSSDFPTTPGAFDPTFNFGVEYDGEVFVARLNAAGSQLDYATYLGGSENDAAAAVAVHETGRATVTGSTRSSNFPTTPGAFDPSYNGGGDAFVARLNAAGSALDYATFLGGSEDDHSYAVAVDGTGRATVTGVTLSSNFPTTPGAFDPSYNGGENYGDAFVARLNAADSQLEYATYLGGSSDDYSDSIAVDGTGRAIVTGFTYSSDFPTTPGAFDVNLNGGTDAFVTKLAMAPYAPNVLAPIEQPAAGAFVGDTVTLRGFAIDLARSTGTGIDRVHIYLDGPLGTGTMIGGAIYGLDRPDVAAQYGARFGPSGWKLTWNTTGLSLGGHRLYLYAHRTADNAWTPMPPHLVVAAGDHLLWLPAILGNR